MQNNVPSQKKKPTAPAPLSLPTIEPLNHPSKTFAGLPGQIPRFPGQTSLAATNSAAGGLFLNNASILSQPCPSVSITSAPKIAQFRPNPIVTLPVNHILPNLSAWSFPVADTSQQSTVTSVVPPPATSLPKVIPSNNSVLSTAQVFPISNAGTDHYMQPFAVVTSTTNCSVPQTSTTFPKVTASPFVPASWFTLSQPSVKKFHDARPCTAFHFDKERPSP